ncbi:hypothetical protein M9H77_36638 [Catharanthus roseus]|uniref:Uncharacterized protein n=1 Tax=Catharanthus roseus TaxID=4058 RepID=A0ACB9ZUC5_CATRO|nr:hypothetical protein M9H77_36638 [Catharanthus roseus]
MAPASGFNRRPCHGKGKGLTGSFLSVMSKISGSRNKRPDKAHDVLAPTQRKKVKTSNWEQTGPTEGGLVDLELIPSYGGHVTGSWFIEVPIATWNLGQASRVDAKELAGYWSLLEGCETVRVRLCIPAHPIRPIEAHRPVNNRMYVVRNLFVEALWLEAPSHLLTEAWISVLAIPPSACTNDYMQWFLPRSHPRIQNPLNIPHGFYVPVDPSMPPQALLYLVARETRREDTRKEEKFDRIDDLLMRHYRAS